MIGLPMLCRTGSESEPDPQAELELNVDAGHLGDDVRVGVAHAVIHLYTVDNVAGARRHGSAKALGAPVMLMTSTALAATKVGRFATALPTSSFALRDSLDPLVGKSTPGGANSA